MNGLPGLTPAEERELSGRLERKQVKSMMDMYSNLVQKCFDSCVNDFTSKSLATKEEGCVMRCVDKWLKASERLGERFQEKNVEMSQQGGPFAR